MTVQNGDVLKITAVLTFATGDVAENIYYLKAVIAAPLTDAQAVNYAETYLDDMYTQVQDYISNSLTLGTCPVDKIEWDGEKWEVVENVGLATPDVTLADTGSLLPYQNAPMALGQTSRPKSNGKKFLMGFTEDSQAGGLLISAAVTALAAYATEWINGYYIGVANELVAGIVRTAVNEFLEFTLGEVSNGIFTQRRRRQGVGA